LFIVVYYNNIKDCYKLRSHIIQPICAVNSNTGCSFPTVRVLLHASSSRLTSRHI